jgi:hypothetical protein
MTRRKFPTITVMLLSKWFNWSAAHLTAIPYLNIYETKPAITFWYRDGQIVSRPLEQWALFDHNNTIKSSIIIYLAPIPPGRNQSRKYGRMQRHSVLMIIKMRMMGRALTWSRIIMINCCTLQGHRGKVWEMLIWRFVEKTLQQNWWIHILHNNRSLFYTSTKFKFIYKQSNVNNLLR